MVRPKSQESAEQSPPVEVEDNLTNHFRHFMECFNDRITLHNLRLGERYAQKEIHVLVHFRFRNSEEFVASFQRKDSGTGNYDGIPVVFRTPAMKSGDPLPIAFERSMSLKGRPSRDQQSMFVVIVKSDKVPEKFSCPTSVWFESVDSFYRILPHSLYRSVSLGPVFRGTSPSREFGIRKSLDGTFSHADQIVCGVVQSTPEIIKSVPDEQGKVHGDGLGIREIVDTLLRLKICLEPETIRVGFEETVALGLQVEDVLFGPFDF